MNQIFKTILDHHANAPGLQDKIAKHTDDVISQMFGSNQKEKQLTLEETILMAKKLELAINYIDKQYADHRGNLEESMRCVADIIDNLIGHQRDIDQGKE